MKTAPGAVGRPRVVVTGATGWIGRAVVERIARSLGSDWQSSVTAFASTAGAQRAPDGSSLRVSALSDLTPAHLDGAHLVHLAYATRERASVLGESAFVSTNRSIDDRVLEASAHGRLRSAFVASSGAARGAGGADQHDSYGLCKLEQESRFLRWAAGSGVPTLVGRVWTISGPHITKPQGFALTDFLLQARSHGRITVRSTVPTFRSYLHVGDLSGLVWKALRDGVGHPTPLDLCGAEVVEVGDLAHAVAARAGGRVEVVRDAVDATRTDAYLGDHTQTKVLAMRLGLPAFADLNQQIADTDRAVQGGVSALLTAPLDAAPTEQHQH